MHRKVCRSAIQSLTSAHQKYQVAVSCNSAKHALRSFDTTESSTNFCFLQPFLPIAQWKKSSTPHLEVEVNWPHLKLHCTSIGDIAATPDLRTPQVSKKHLLRKIRAETVSFPTYVTKTIFISEFCIETGQIRKSCVEIVTMQLKRQSKSVHCVKYTAIHHRFEKQSLRTKAKPPFSDLSKQHLTMYVSTPKIKRYDFLA